MRAVILGSLGPTEKEMERALRSLGLDVVRAADIPNAVRLCDAPARCVLVVYAPVADPAATAGCLRELRRECPRAMLVTIGPAALPADDLQHAGVAAHFPEPVNLARFRHVVATLLGLSAEPPAAQIPEEAVEPWALVLIGADGTLIWGSPAGRRRVATLTAGPEAAIGGARDPSAAFEDPIGPGVAEALLESVRRAARGWVRLSGLAGERPCDVLALTARTVVGRSPAVSALLLDEELDLPDLLEHPWAQLLLRLREPRF